MAVGVVGVREKLDEVARLLKLHPETVNMAVSVLPEQGAVLCLGFEASTAAM